MYAIAAPWGVLIGALVGLLVLWSALVVIVLLLHRKNQYPPPPGLRPVGSPARGERDSKLGEGLRILPDTVRLLRRVAADPAVPRGVRFRIYALLLYLVSPIDLIPDFVPVVGYADDVVIVAAALRLIVRRAGAETVRRHWAGTEEGLATLQRIAGFPSL